MLAFVLAFVLAFAAATGTAARSERLASLTLRSPRFSRLVELLEHGDPPPRVVPKLAPPVRSRLETAVFDVAALARNGHVPLKVTFAKGAAPRALPGLQVRTSTARSAASGRTTATASYDARRPLPPSLATSLRGVSRISLAQAAPQVAPAYQLHTLTINVTTRKGKPIPGADVFLFDADDARLLGTFGGVIDGPSKSCVPTGNYIVLVDDFSHVVLRQVSVTDDAVADLSMAAATVKPKITAITGPSRVESALARPGVDADDDRLGRSNFGLVRILPKVSPLTHVVTGPAPVPKSPILGARGVPSRSPSHGGQVKTPAGIEEQGGGRRAGAGEGIPHRLAYRCPPPRTQRHRRPTATQPGRRGRGLRPAGWPLSPVDQFLFVEGCRRPPAELVVHASYLGRQEALLGHEHRCTDRFGHFTELDQVAESASPSRAGAVLAERGWRPWPVRSGNWSASRLWLCVHPSPLHRCLAILAQRGTGPSRSGRHGQWALFRGQQQAEPRRPLLPAERDGEGRSADAAEASPDSPDRERRSPRWPGTPCRFKVPRSEQRDGAAAARGVRTEDEPPRSPPPAASPARCAPRRRARRPRARRESRGQVVRRRPPLSLTRTDRHVPVTAPTRRPARRA